MEYTLKLTSEQRDTLLDVLENERDEIVAAVRNVGMTTRALNKRDVIELVITALKTPPPQRVPLEPLSNSKAVVVKNSAGVVIARKSRQMTTKEIKAIPLTFVRIERTETHVRSSDDRRRFVDKTIAVYLDDNGDEYVKTFEHKDTKFSPPKNGANGDLTQMRFERNRK